MKGAERTYPDEPAGPFPRPPHSFTDKEGRSIEVRLEGEDCYEDIIDMYLEFDSKDRAQGIPPITEREIRRWMDQVIREDCINVVAWHEDKAVGHSMIVPDNQGTFELAIFVLGAYQSAGIGTELIQTLLGTAGEQGIERVWLTVERWNEPAIALYKKVGFEVCGSESFELEMVIRLDSDSDAT